MLTMEKQALTQLKQRNSHHSQKMLEFCKQQALSQDKYQKECISALQEYEENQNQLRMTDRWINMKRKQKEDKKSKKQEETERKIIEEIKKDRERKAVEVRT